ncbi:LPS export ABC transporter periplasmic protein LptC [Guyparkeria sp. 1SP6A2]|nr:LPS export ABC transporter periplasmic protein LptC [Guyparkeria sp. 1SP6A2]
MTARSYKIGLAVSALALLGLLTWHNLSGPSFTAADSTDGYAQRIDTGVSWQYDENGTLTYRLQTPRATHLDDRGEYRLIEPTAMLLDEDPATPPWTLSAKRGTILDQGGTLKLEHDVHAQRNPVEAMGRLELRTERLWIYPNEQLARSDTLGRLSETTRTGTTRWTSEADRLELDWAARHLTQTGRVRDNYRPGSVPAP